MNRQRATNKQRQSDGFAARCFGRYSEILARSIKLIAAEKFELIKQHIAESVVQQNSSYLVDKVKEMDLSFTGEVNYMCLNCSYIAPDNSSIVFSFKSYDPSGPFQNLPDVNKIKLQLFQNQNLVSEVVERYDDKSVYG